MPLLRVFDIIMFDLVIDRFQLEGASQSARTISMYVLRVLEYSCTYLRNSFFIWKNASSSRLYSHKVRLFLWECLKIEKLEINPYYINAHFRKSFDSWRRCAVFLSLLSFPDDHFYNFLTSELGFSHTSCMKGRSFHLETSIPFYVPILQLH